jgi:hypothetical protein
MRRLLWMALLAIPITACDTDRGARKDLPINNQQLNESDAQVYLMPDQFPNVTHKCDGTLGIWTTTDRAVWIVYNDPRCDGDGSGPVLDNIPGSQTVVAP